MSVYISAHARNVCQCVYVSRNVVTGKSCFISYLSQRAWERKKEKKNNLAPLLHKSSIFQHCQFMRVLKLADDAKVDSLLYQKHFEFDWFSSIAFLLPQALHWNVGKYKLPMYLMVEKTKYKLLPPPKKKLHKIYLACLVYWIGSTWWAVCPDAVYTQ